MKEGAADRLERGHAPDAGRMRAVSRVHSTLHGVVFAILCLGPAVGSLFRGGGLRHQPHAPHEKSRSSEGSGASSSSWSCAAPETSRSRACSPGFASVTV